MIILLHVPLKESSFECVWREWRVNQDRAVEGAEQGCGLS